MPIVIRLGAIAGAGARRLGRRAARALGLAGHVGGGLRRVVPVRAEGRIWIPRRLAELVVGIAVLPLGAVVTLTVSAVSVPSGIQIQGPPLSAADSFLRLPARSVQDPLAAASGIDAPALMALPAAPGLSRLQSTSGTAIPPNTYSGASVQAIITAAAQADGVDPSWMIRTAECESGLRPNAYNPSGPYYGLFQFLMSTFRAHGGTDIWDPVEQSQIAASMFASGDSGAWPVCSHA